MLINNYCESHIWLVFEIRPCCQMFALAMWCLSFTMWPKLFWILLNSYSLISMRLIYYFDTWAIFDMAVFQYFWRFAQICKKLAAYAHKIVFVIVSVVKLFRNNNTGKNNFVSKCCKFLANVCKSSEILEQCHVNWWIGYRIYGSVSYSFSCTDEFTRYFQML